MIKSRYVSLLLLVLMLLAVQFVPVSAVREHSANLVGPQTAEAGKARFWLRATFEPANADLEVSLDDGTTWSDIGAGLIQFTNADPVRVRNVGSASAQIEEVRSSTGDPLSLDGLQGGYTLKPGSEMVFQPGKILVVAANVVGVVKRVGGAVVTVLGWIFGGGSVERVMTVDLLSAPEGDLAAFEVIQDKPSSGSVTLSFLGVEGSILVESSSPISSPVVLEPCSTIIYDSAGNIASGPTSILCQAVGGVAELPEVASTPLEAPDSSGSNTGALAGAIAGAVLAGGVTLGGAAWYKRRRLISR